MSLEKTSSASTINLFRTKTANQANAIVSMLRSIFISSLLVGLAIMGYLYLYSFDDHSETELVRLSYNWFPFLVFGMAGLEGEKGFDAGIMGWLGNAFWFALFWMAMSTAFLVFFFEAIFPSL